MLDVQATIDAAGSAGKVAALGYCWGGSLAYIAAARLGALSCAVGYYGAQIAAHSGETPHVPVLLHYAETDEYIPQSDLEKVRQAQPAVTSINIRAPSTASTATTAASMSRRAPQSLAAARCRSFRIMSGNHETLSLE